MKIMLVDDNSEIRALLRRILDDTRTQFIECADGDEACRRYEEHRPDWVLMDIQLQRMNGLVATKWICRKFPEARVMVVTHYADEVFRTAARQAGARGFVSKANLLQIRELIT